MTTALLRTILRSRKLWSACIYVAALPAAVLILLLTFMLNNSDRSALIRLQPVRLVAAPALHPLDQATPSRSTLPSPASKVGDTLHHSTTYISGKCDLLQGEWVPDLAPPAYTNKTCKHIQDAQNCLRNGRPDSRFLFWKWKPHGCNELRGNARTFLQAMRGRTLAFVGDSIARNQMQSLLCLLDQVEKPSNTLHSDDDKFNQWYFPSHSFTLTVHWSPFLVKHSTKPSTTAAASSTPIMELDLDVLDEAWVKTLPSTDVLVISSGQWFYKAAVYKQGGHIIGCHHCNSEDNTVKEIGFFNAYKRAMRTVLGSLPGLARDTVVILRTFAPDHFENGGWDTGGTCPRTVPGGLAITEMNWMMHDIEVMEMKKATGEAGNASNLRLLDITELAQVRSDGHPGPYSKPYPSAAAEEKKEHIDCLHWCLPGPIDTWNEILMETLQH